MNILLLIVLALLIIKIVSGSKLGMVREIISFVSLIVLSLFVILVGKGLQSYADGEIFSLVVVAFLLGILGILHHLLGVVFLPAKLPCNAERVFNVSISARHLRACGLLISASISSTKYEFFQFFPAILSS